MMKQESSSKPTSTNPLKSLKRSAAKVEKQQILRIQRLNEWYNLRPMLGFANWALFYILLGGREVGKSYSVTNFFVDQFVHKGIPFT